MTFRAYTLSNVSIQYILTHCLRYFQFYHPTGTDRWSTSSEDSKFTTNTNMHLRERKTEMKLNYRKKIFAFKTQSFSSCYLCADCDVSCVSCLAPGPTGCIKCKEGFTMTEAGCRGKNIVYAVSQTLFLFRTSLCLFPGRAAPVSQVSPRSAQWFGCPFRTNIRT